MSSPRGAALPAAQRAVDMLGEADSSKIDPIWLPSALDTLALAYFETALTWRALFTPKSGLLRRYLRRTKLPEGCFKETSTSTERHSLGTNKEHHLC